MLVRFPARFEAQPQPSPHTYALALAFPFSLNRRVWGLAIRASKKCHAKMASLDPDTAQRFFFDIPTVLYRRKMLKESPFCTERGRGRAPLAGKICTIP